VSNSPYAAPIVMVRKLDGSIRVCVDYIALNEGIVKDSFPLPRIDDLLDKQRSAKCMTHLDLRSAYNQVRISDDGPQDDSIVASAFQGLTPNVASCLMKMLVMGFGLCNAPATFSRLINHVLEPYINKFVIVYLYDICIYSETTKQHIEHLRLVLQKLRERHLFIKMPICVGTERKQNTLVSLLAMKLFEQHLITSRLLEIGLYQKLKRRLSPLCNFVLTTVKLFTIFRIVLRH
jgi:hypothetical protein